MAKKLGQLKSAELEIDRERQLGVNGDPHLKGGLYRKPVKSQGRKQTDDGVPSQARAGRASYFGLFRFVGH
ncbi:MAG: hypothetical protein KAU28_11110 [Phycisphaerae bacterium]|nr:hypothetical protein [Phycisphaerae bacterium]